MSGTVKLSLKLAVVTLTMLRGDDQQQTPLGTFGCTCCLDSYGCKFTIFRSILSFIQLILSLSESQRFMLQSFDGPFVTASWNVRSRTYVCKFNECFECFSI